MLTSAMPRSARKVRAASMSACLVRVSRRRVGLHVAETAAPVLGFTLLYATTARPAPALPAGVCVAALVAVHRLRQARSVWPAASGPQRLARSVWPAASGPRRAGSR
ncbi:hypothetical protein ACTWPW_14270 [Nonomuraea sp. KM90]